MTKRKQRALAAPAAPAANAPPPPATEPPSADGSAPLQRRFSALAADVLALPAALERTLWLHNVALLLVQHALLYDESVTREQALLLLWTALWLGRACLATWGCGEPLPILRREREKSVLWRVALAAGGAALQLAFLRVSGAPQRRKEHLLLLLPIYLLDAAGVVLLHLADAQLTWPQVALAAVEAPILTSVFSVLYTHREFLVYDRVAFALTAVSCSVHTAALLAAKVVARSAAPHGASTAQWSQRRGRALVAELRRAAESEEETQVGRLLQLEATRAVAEPRARVLVEQPQPHKPAKSSKRQPSEAPAESREGDSSAAPLSLSASLLQHASVRVAALVAAQSLLLLTQVALSAVALLSWELASVLLLSSSHVLYTLVQLHQSLATPPPPPALSRV